MVRRLNQLANQTDRLHVGIEVAVAPTSFGRSRNDWVARFLCDAAFFWIVWLVPFIELPSLF